MQKAKPLKGKQRAEYVKGLPDLSTGCPCPGLKGMGDEEVNLSPPDKWFCDTAAPQLHRNIMEEMSVLAWIIQEATDPADAKGEPGSRVGLMETGMFILLKRLVTLKKDTLSLLASMQITRVRAALGRVPKEKKDSEKTKPIISAEIMEEDDKQEEKKAQKTRQRCRLFGFPSARRGRSEGTGRSAEAPPSPSVFFPPLLPDPRSPGQLQQIHLQSTSEQLTGSSPPEETLPQIDTRPRSLQVARLPGTQRRKGPTLLKRATRTLLTQNLQVVGDFLTDPSPELAPYTATLDKETLRVGNQPVGGRLSFFAESWSSSYYHKSLREGLRFRWVEEPPDMDMGEEVPDEEEDRQALLDMNQDLLDKGAVEVAPQAPNKGCVFKMFLVDKKGTQEKRPVVNMRPLSPFVVSPHFKMEGLNVARDLIEQGDWFARLDLKDAYLHVPLHPLIRLWFRYRVQGTLYQWCTLPFGFRDAPRTFQKLVVEAVTPLRQQGVRLVVYLDDILVMAQSQSQCRNDIRRLVALLLRLGFVINLAKSELAPSQHKVFLGTLIDSISMQFFLPRSKIKSFKARIVATLKRAEAGEEATLEEIQSIVGTLGSTTECVPAVRLRLNSLIEMQNRALHSKSGRTLLADKAISDLR